MRVLPTLRPPLVGLGGQWGVEVGPLGQGPLEQSEPAEADLAGLERVLGGGLDLGEDNAQHLTGGIVAFEDLDVGRGLGAVRVDREPEVTEVKPALLRADLQVVDTRRQLDDLDLADAQRVQGVTHLKVRVFLGPDPVARGPEHEDRVGLAHDGLRNLLVHELTEEETLLDRLECLAATQDCKH